MIVPSGFLITKPAAELTELTDSVPWKWWAKYQDFDKQNKVEIVNFLISLAQVMSMSADDVYDIP